MKSFLVIVLLLFFHFISGAQTISGKVQDAIGKPVAQANILLIKLTDSSLMKTTITDEMGSFLFDDIKSENYQVRMKHIGYETYSSDSIKLEGSNVDMGIISLKENKELDGVTVRAKKPMIEIHADKLVVNVENSIVNTGANALEVLGRSPGVTVDQNENVRLKGKSGLTIMIDGKITPLQGADLANILKSMAAATIEKIEIISNPGARYDAAGSGGIINIKTKKDRRKGINGSVHSGYGQGVYHKINTGFNLSYRKNKWTINTTYNYSNRANFNNLTIKRIFYDKNRNPTAEYNQTGATIYPVRNHNGSLAIDHNLSKKTTIGIGMTGDRALFDPRGDNYSRVDSGKTYTFFNTSNRSNDAWFNYSLNAYLRHDFDSNGRTLAIDADYARFWNQTYQRYTNKYYNTDGGFLLPDYLLFGDLSGLTEIRSVKLDYSQPILGKARLDAGAKASLVTADNSLLFHDQTGGRHLYDSSKSNHFLYRENINAIYLNIAKDGEKWSLQTGLRAEQTIARGNQVTTNKTFDRNYTQLFPSLAVQRHINKHNDIGITLSRRIDRPNYRQLNPFRYFLDPTNSRIGNPYLLPSLTYSAEVSHIYKQKFVSNIGYSVSKDIIIETLEADTTNPNTSINSNKNLGYQYYFGYSGSYSPSVTKWWNLVANINLNYNQFKGNLSNTPLNTGQIVADVNLTNSFVLPANMSAEISGYYQTPQRWGYYTFKSLYSLNLGIQKIFFERKLTVKAACNDLFRSSAPRAAMHFINFTEYFTAIRDTRVFTLSLSYRFGNHQQSSRRHRSGAEDEKRRASGNG